MSLSTTWRYLPWILLLLVLSRASAVVFFGTVDIQNDSGVLIRLAGAPAYLDYGLYQAASDSARSEIARPIKFLSLLWDNPHQAIQWLFGQKIKPGPILPLLLNQFQYDQNRTTLAVIYLISGGLLGLVWAWGLHKRGAGIIVQLVAAVFPSLIYYSFLVSTDLLYAVVLSGVFLSALWAMSGGRVAYLVLGVLMLLALATRPNALALVLAIALLPLFRKEANTFRASWLLIWGLIGAYAFIYYLPYYFVHDSNAGRTHYWGIYPDEYYAGLFPDLPGWINQPFSLAVLAISKLLHAAGIRPSYSDVDLWLVIARSLPGLLYLPGMLYSLIRAPGFERLFLACFLVPVFVGAAQERYLLPVAPLLLFWALAFYKDFALRLGLVTKSTN